MSTNASVSTSSLPSPTTIPDESLTTSTLPQYTSRQLFDLWETPLDLPYMEAEDECAVTAVGDAVPAVAQTYGDGPVYSTPGTWDSTVGLTDTSMRDGRYRAKVLWSVTNDYEGPVLIRGRQLDGPHVVLFEPPAPGWPEIREWEGTELVELFFRPDLPPGDQIARFYPTTALIPEPGCYAFQVDALVRHNYRDVIVFRAVAE